MKGFDAFERSLKESMGSYEVPYNSADWTQLEQRLAVGGAAGLGNPAGLYALLASGTVAVVTTVVMMMQGTGDGKMTKAKGVEMPQDLTVENVVRPTGAGVVRLDHEAIQVQDTRTNEGLVAEEPTVKNQQAAANTASHRSSHQESLVSAITAERPSEPASKELLIKPSVTKGCPGTEVVFALTNMPEEGIHLWNFGDGSFSNKPTPTHIFTKAGTYEVMLSHSSVGGGSFNNKPASDLIIIHEAPEAKFTPLKREFDNSIPSWHFENRSIGGQSYLWDFGDGTTSTTPYPDHVFKKKGNYTVSLTVTNAQGCVDRTERTVRVDSDYDLQASKMFSPDGDGFEDTFIPEALRNLGVKFHFSVFDARTGQLIYETGDAKRPWNGRIQNKGEYCQPGEYLWMVEMKDGEKLGGTYNGSVDLVR